MSTVVYFEIPTDNIERSKKFYSDLFDWKIEPSKESTEYLSIKTTGDKAIGGRLIPRKHPQHQITNYIDVSSVDEYSNKVKLLQGKIIVPKTPVPGVGYFAICLDTENNIFGLWETNPNAGVFASPEEVFTAILVSIIFSDEKYSVDEMQTVWNEIDTLEIFKNQKYKELERKVLSYFNKKETAPSPFTDTEIDIILSSAKQLLTPTLREQAFRYALKLAKADKTIDGYTLDIDEREQKLLNRIQKALELSQETVQKIIEEIKPKYV